MAVDSPAERVRQAMQRWMDTTGMTQREFAKDLGKSQVWLQKILQQGGNQPRLRDIDIIANAMHTTAAELVRADNHHYQLELTPTELRVLQHLRRRPELLDAVATLCNIPPASPAPPNRTKPTLITKRA